MKMLVSRYAATFAGTAGASHDGPGHKVWDYLADCPVADDACLIVSEFASNAVLHSLSRVGTFTVRCELFSTYIWVEVEDEGGFGVVRILTVDLMASTSCRC